MPDRLATTLRRLALWTVICAVSAAPSFALAAREFDRGAMIVGVALFILAYTAATSTAAFERFHNRPFVRRTLYIGYGVRLALSLAFPLGVGADMLPGILSLRVVEELGLNTRSFAGTLAATIVQGALLNALIFLFMATVYAIQRATMKPPSGPEAMRGFEVVVPALPVAADDGAAPAR